MRSRSRGGADPDTQDAGNRCRGEALCRMDDRAELHVDPGSSWVYDRTAPRGATVQADRVLVESCSAHAGDGTLRARGGQATIGDERELLDLAEVEDKEDLAGGGDLVLSDASKLDASSLANCRQRRVPDR